MAPIPTVQNSSEKRTPNRAIAGSSITGERKSELVTRVKYCNTLPDLPFDTKFLAYPFPSNRFVDYATTSLERNYVYEVLTEPDLGVDVELVIPNAYNLPPNVVPPLDPIDEKLLEDEIVAQKDQKRSRHHAKSVSWLRRTEYISTEQTRFQPQSIDKVEAKVGWSVKKKLKDEMGNYMDRDSQIKSIEKTFEDSLMPIESHFAKPGVTPVEILPVFPDFKLWKYPCAQVIFDSDPAPVGRSVPAQLEEMSQAMIRGVMDESGEQFVAYFLPTEETLEKRKNDSEASREYEDDQVYEYRMAREYNWNVKSKANKGYEENYFFVIRDDGVYYNELETRVRLNKRRVRGPHQQLNTKLCVKHKELEASDYKFQRKRERELEPLGEEDEEEEEETMEVEKSDQSEDERGSAKNNESGDSDNDDAKSDKSAKSDRVRGSDAESNKSNKKSDSEDSDAEGKKSDDDAKSGSYKSDDDAKSPRSDRSSKSKASQRSRSPRKSRSRSKSGSRSRSSSSGSRSGSGSASRSGSGSGSDSGSEKSGGSDKSDASDEEK